MRKQLCYSYLAVIILAILGTSIAFCSLGYSYLKEENYNRFGEEVYLLAGELAEKDMTNKKTLDAFVENASQRIDARISIISGQGYVIADSDSKTKENHKHRKEVMQAMEGKVGRDIRGSATTGISYYYTAVKMTNNGVDYIVRIAMPQENVNQLVYQLAISIITISIICLTLAMLLAYYFVRKITDPVYDISEKAEQIAAGDYKIHIRPTGTGHIYRLSRSLDHMVESLRNNQKTLEKQNEELREMEELRAQFVSNVTHELKTPLTSIRGFVDTLREGAINDEKVAMRFLDIIDIESARLSRLISDVLSLSEIEQRKDGEIIYCNVVETVSEVEEIIHMKMKKKKKELKKAGKKPSEVKLLVEIGDDIPDYPCDEAHMKEVLINLVDNALKYTSEGSVTLRVFEWNHILHILVMDTGIGIAEEHLPRLFERFYRVDKGRSRKQGGTGLGLSIVKHIVDLYGGTIKVESNLGYGTTFRIYFPYKQEEA
ncbi:MAG: ATP-binding protein [Lachnospiraceae bacterium]|nr:ATP-binding protein [Lachnospiraceae bacterium]